jgi:hypothetical protein
VLPQDYRDLLEVAEDAGRPLRAAQIAAAAVLPRATDQAAARAAHGNGAGRARIGAR